MGVRTKTMQGIVALRNDRAAAWETGRGELRRPPRRGDAAMAVAKEAIPTRLSAGYGMLLGASLFALAAAEPAAAQQVSAGSPQSAPARSASELEDIVVTATRRDESLQKTPTSIAAFSGARLQQAQITNLDDLAQTTPNIQISSANTTSNIAIRGIGNNQAAGGSDPGVALHADSVYLAQTGLVASTFLDINRVEILRGPQGTLFGRNATGGAVNLIPNYPTRDLHYGVNLSAGFDPGTIRTQAFISGPLDDGGTVRARLAVQQNYNDGFARNLAPDGPHRLDNQNNFAARGQLQWLPGGGFDVRASVEYQRANDNGGAYYLLGTPMAGPLPVFIATSPTGNPDKDTIQANVGVHKLDSLTATLTANLALAGGNLRAIYSYNRVNQVTDTDSDGTAVPFSDTAFDQRSHQSFAELLYASDPGKPFDFILGANYFNERLKQNVLVSVIFFPPGVGVNVIGDIRTESYAFFAHGTYKIGTGVKLFAGVRYSHDARSIDDFNNFIGSLSQSKSWSRVTYEVGGSWDFTRNITGYVKYATGYKGGGFSAGTLAPAFNPETDASIEAGLKGSYLGGRLQANLALFRMKYDNLQVTQITGITTLVTNAAKADINGLEAEVVARPFRPLRVEISAGYLDARFKEFVTADSSRPALGTLNLSGNRLPLAPGFTGSAGAYYDIPAGSGRITLGARYDYRSRVYFSEFNIPVASQAAAGKLDLSLSYVSRDDRWSASLFARNVFDKRTLGQSYVVSAVLGSLALGQYQPGRQVGASVGYRF